MKETIEKLVEEFKSKFVHDGSLYSRSIDMTVEDGLRALLTRAFLAGRVDGYTAGLAKRPLEAPQELLDKQKAVL